MNKSIKTKSKVKETLNIDEAIENLTTIAEINIDQKTLVGIIQNTRLTTNEDEVSYKELQWLFPEDSIAFLEYVKPSVLVVLNYLKDLYDDEATNWNDKNFIENIQSIMALVADAANKLSQYFLLFEKEVDLTQTDEYINLQAFYLETFMNKFPKKLEGKKIWSDQWKDNKEKEVLDFDRSGVKDFSFIETDVDYDLFYIKNIDGESFFSPELIRNLKLYVSYDEHIDSKDDFFNQLIELQNKDFFFSAKQILRSIDSDIHAFYKYKFDKKENVLAALINKSFMALMLASNLDVYGKSSVKKSSLKYFEDFILFLRKTFHTDQYQKSFDNNASQNIFLINLVNKLTYAFFTRLGGVKEEVIGYVHRMIRKGNEEEKLTKPESIFNSMLYNDENIRAYLKNFPNGPLALIVKDLENIEEEDLVFDPILQNNIPAKLFEISILKNKVDVLHLPSPISQRDISQASLVDEFLAFLRHLNKDNKNHLLINLQDSTSLREAARSKVIEQIQNRAEFEKAITVITLSKSSFFYNQTGEYEFDIKADKFMGHLKNNLITEAGQGYFLPVKYKKDRFFLNWLDKILGFIHQTFYLEKTDLSKQERKDFIELFYHFLVLKIMEMEDISSLSFTCKDGIDVGASMAASFFSFIKLISSDLWNKEDLDMLLWLIYEPALLIRHRAIDSKTLIRSLSAISLFDANSKGIKKLAKNFYDIKFIDSLKITYLH